MAKKTIKLTTQEELKVFMSPQRQKLMRVMRVNGEALTSKAIADIMGISASSVQFHIKKLEKLGIVELDHTEIINGIQAKYYTMAEINVNIGAEQEDDLSSERYIVMQNLMKNTFEGLVEFYESGISNDQVVNNSEFINGFINLKREDSQELLKLIREFVASHEKSEANTQVWEYTIMLYNTETVENLNNK